MSKTLSAISTTVAVTDIVRYGEKLVLPEHMTLDQAAGLIERRKEYESQITTVNETFDAFPLDGAVSLNTVLNRRYGWSPAVSTPGFFSDNPPSLISVDIGYNKTIQVPWGRFMLPNVEGYIETSISRAGGRYKFAVKATIKRISEPVIKALFDELRTEIKENSIYRGKAIRISFLDSDNDVIPNPEPKFLDTDSVNEEMLILSDHLHRAVNTNLFTPITRSQDCLDNGIPIKRGVLLGGTFGTGKTLIAHVASKKAVQSGISFVYIKRAVELSYAIEFARQYQSPACAIFCEDIDRETSGERTEDMDTILNTIDGIDSKTTNIIVVLTTNNIKGIHQAMLRPGRLDAVLDITPPDAKAIERLVHAYAGTSLEPNIDLKEVGEVLEGNIPAVIAEVVKRAKLSQLSLQPAGTKVTMLTSEALLESARTIQAQVELLKPKEEETKSNLEIAFGTAVKNAFNGNSESIQTIRRKVDQVHAKVV